MLNVNDLRNGTVFKDENQLFAVITFEHVKTGRGSGNIKVKVRNIKTGSITEKSFITGARVDEANIEKRKAQFLYKDEDSFNFMDPQTYEQFSLTQDQIGELAKYLKENLDVVLIVGEGETFGMELPNTVIYEIAETGPGERGNTVSNVYKEATLENGLVVRVPMFMDAGEKVKVDTRTGEYVERVR